MPSDSDRYPTLGILAIAYGAILCFSWGVILWAKGDEGSLSWPATLGAWLTTLLFAAVPALLIYAGCVLRSPHADARRRVAVAATAAALLGAKACLACSWAFDELQYFQAGWLLAGLAFGVLVGLVAAPSGVWALVLAGVAARLTGAHATDIADRSGSNASGRARVWGVLALGSVLLLAGVVLAWISNSPRSVTAAELLAAYAQDAHRADAEYKGRCVTVSGKVAERRTISTLAPWSGTVWIKLEAKDKVVPGVVTVRVGDLPFDPRPAGATYQDFTRLAEGQEVTIRGRCGGMTDSGVTIEMPLIVK
jgi:MFS family permease